MGTLVEKINYLKETKTAIKNAITAKGVSVSDTDTFRSYAGKIGEIQSGSSGGGSENNAFVDFSKYTHGGYLYKVISSIDLSSFDTSNLTKMTSMFYGCSGLQSLDGLNSFDTSTVTGMDSVFYNCSSLPSLDLRSFNTSNVTAMGYMFFGCSNITSLDLSSFNTSKVTKMGSMFKNCSKLQTLTLGNNWASNKSITSFDLSPCTALSHDSLVDVMNKLATRTNSPTITLSTESKALLTDSEKAIATGKGWTIA